MTGKQKLVWLIILAVLNCLGLFVLQNSILLNIPVMIGISILTFLFPSTFSMGISDENNRSIFFKLISMSFVFALILLSQYVKSGIMCGIYAGILLSYTAKLITKKVIKK